MDIVFASQRDVPHEPWVSALQEAMPEMRVRDWNSEAQPSGARIAVVWSPPAELFTREPNIEIVFNLGAGVDALFALPAWRDDVRVVRVEDAGMAVQLAEYAIYFLLRVTRAFDAYEGLQRQARWARQADIDRARWPVGVLGTGLMGARVAQAIAALEYPVAGWSRSGRPLPGIEVYGEADLSAFLRRTRVLINVLPLTPQTEGILCHETLSQLMPDAYLINMGRGRHLIEDDLLAMLASGQLRGAALDVFTQEPLPPDHPFWSHPRISVTPHNAAVSLISETVRQIALKVRAYTRGDAISGVVDPRLRY